MAPDKVGKLLESLALLAIHERDELMHAATIDRSSEFHRNRQKLWSESRGEPVVFSTVGSKLWEMRPAMLPQHGFTPFRDAVSRAKTAMVVSAHPACATLMPLVEAVEQAHLSLVDNFFQHSPLMISGFSCPPIDEHCKALNALISYVRFLHECSDPEHDIPSEQATATIPAEDEKQAPPDLAEAPYLGLTLDGQTLSREGFGSVELSKGAQVDAVKAMLKSRGSDIDKEQMQRNIVSSTASRIDNIRTRLNKNLLKLGVCVVERSWWIAETNVPKDVPHLGRSSR